MKGEAERHIMEELLVSRPLVEAGHGISLFVRDHLEEEEHRGPIGLPRTGEGGPDPKGEVPAGAGNEDGARVDAGEAPV